MNLPKAMAIIPPQNAIHNGKMGGNVNPSSKPVMTADQSPTVLSFPVHLQSQCSVKTHEITLVPITSNAPNPNE